MIAKLFTFLKNQAKKEKSPDNELERFRNLMEVPSTFEDGFSLTSIAAALFIGMVMVPGALYMELLAGVENIGPAAQWVTVILFIEAARRAHKNLRRAEVYILFFMAGIAMNAPFEGLLYRQFFIQSDAANAYGIAQQLPRWFAPQPSESETYSMRTFFHSDWLPVIGIITFKAVFSQFSSQVLGYGLFRVASDMEKLPFPMAPIGAQGIMALAEDLEESEDKRRSADKSWRWRVFSIGGAIGLIFGSIYLALPVISSLFSNKSIMILPIPWYELSPKTQEFLPAVATGMSFDLSNVILGMVLPFFAMLGSFIGLIGTFIMNPILHEAGIIKGWNPGDTTVAIIFKNNVDFYLSFQIGLSIVIASAGIIASVKAAKKFRRELKLRKQQKEKLEFHSLVKPASRGDMPNWVIIATYFIVTLSYVGLSGYLIDWNRNVIIVLCFFGFLYTPLISYVTARLEGIAGQVIEVPMIREAAFILSGYKGMEVWALPIPVANYGIITVGYRQAELTGTKFTSMWKTVVCLYPLILVMSIIFANFIWSLAPVPCYRYPYAEKMWELQANNQSIMWTSTSGDYSLFEDAFSWEKLSAGVAAGGILFAIFSFFQAPTFFIYGVVRGLGQPMPHMIVPQFIGALIGRFYFQKRLGLKWRQYIPVVMAGFTCGMGLITTACIGFRFLGNAAIQLPF